MKNILACLVLLPISLNAYAAQPDCINYKGWARTLGYYYFNKSTLLGDENYDYKNQIVTRLASEQINENIFHQVHHFKNRKANGAPIAFIVTTRATADTCHVDRSNAYIVTKSFEHDH